MAVSATAGAATGTIADDDAITASVTVAPASVNEDGTGVAGTLVYTISLDHASAFPTTVTYTLTGLGLRGERLRDHHDA